MSDTLPDFQPVIDPIVNAVKSEMAPADGAHSPHGGGGALAEIVYLLFFAFAAVMIMRQFKLSPVLGYLAAGIVIGEYGLGLVNADDFHFVAEFGIVFLMFMIGQELTFSRLREMRSYIIGIGSLQMLITSGVIGYICYRLIGLEAVDAALVGVALALSSTAVVMRVLADRNLPATQTGRLCIAILILQDLIVVPVLVLLPELNQPISELMTIGFGALLKSVFVLGLMLLAGNFLLKPIYDIVSKSNELFLLTTLLVILGSALITLYAELSLAMGAFAAGLLVGGTHHQMRVHELVEPFKDLLMGLFFMTVGMSININTLADSILVISIIVVLLLAIKAGVLIAICRAARIPWSSTLMTGFMLSQGGEFAFIVFSIASAPDIMVIPEKQAQLLMLVVTITMAVTPILAPAAHALALRIQNREERRRELSAGSCKEALDLNNHVILVGFGKTGEIVGRMLAKHGINYVAIDGDTRNVRKKSGEGYPVHHGSPYDVNALKNLGLERCKAVIVAVSQLGKPEKIVRAIRANAPADIQIICRSRDAEEGQGLAESGASAVAAEKGETALRLARIYLEAHGGSAESIRNSEEKIRDSGYSISPTETMPVKIEKPAE